MKKWGQKKFFFGSKKKFFSGQKKIFFAVMAHWNYGEMTIKTWVELFLDFEHFVIFFCKKMHIYILRIFWINCTCLLNYKKKIGKIKKTSPTKARTHTNSEIIPTQLSSSLTPSTKPSPPRCLHGKMSISKAEIYIHVLLTI